jgi:thioredoxin-like negative regulator of GroEL
MLSKILETVNTEVPIEEYDIDEHMDYAKEFGIRGVPTMIMLDANTEIKRTSGVSTKEELETWLND